MKKLSLSFVALALTVGVAVGCSKSPETTASTGNNQTAATSGNNSNSNGTSSNGNSNGNSVTPSIPNVPGNIPGIPGGDVNKLVGDAEKCAELTTAFAGVWTPLANPTGVNEAGIKKAQQTLQDIKSKVPAKIQSDLETLENGIKDAKSYEDVSKFVSSPEYTKASTNLTNYLTSECSKIGS